jgi:hypothetical protein
MNKHTVIKKVPKTNHRYKGTLKHKNTAIRKASKKNTAIKKAGITKYSYKEALKTKNAITKAQLTELQP